METAEIESAVSQEDNRVCKSNQEHVCIFLPAPSKQSSFSPMDYKSLKTIMLIGLQMDSIEGIQALLDLEELWIVDGNLQQDCVGPLGECVKLKRLYLYSNELTSIPDLSKANKLEQLWLNDNQINTLENVNSLTVKELHLSNNEITEIDVKFKSTLNITTLSLAGNPISRFLDVQKLSSLRKLRRLTFSDPLYKSSPVALLAHFRSFVVFSLPQLEILDLMVIKESERKLTGTFFETKLQYYRLYANNALAKLNSDRNAALISKTQEFDMIRSMIQSHGPVSDKKEVEKSTNLKFWESEAMRWKERWHLCIRLYELLETVTFQRIEMELQHCGNLKFEELDLRDDTLMNEFKNKINSFICPVLNDKVVCADLNNVWSIQGPSLTTILQSQFQGSWDDVFIIAPLEDFSVKPFQLVERLLFGNQADTELFISNCIARSDPLVSDLVLVHRQLLLRSHELLKTRVMILCGVLGGTDLMDQSNSSDFTETSGAHDCKCRMYPLADVSLLVPLYIIHFHYVFQDYFEPLKVSFLSKPQANENISSLNTPLQSEITPITQNFTKLVLTNSNIHDLEIPPMEHVTILDMSYNHLKSVSGLGQTFPKLASLDLTFNRVESLNGSHNLKFIIQLVLKWNLLTDFMDTLQKLKELSILKQLDLSWNPFRDVIYKDHQLWFVYRHLGSLQLYKGRPLPRSLASGQSVLLGQDQVTLVPAWRGHASRLTLRWKTELSGEEVNHLGVISKDIITVSLKKLKLSQIRSIVPTNKVKWLDLSYNFFTGCGCLKLFPSLEEANLSHNVVETVSCPNERFKHLTRLNLSHNYLVALSSFTCQSFPHMKILDLSYNRIQSLAGLSGLNTLVELYLTHNFISSCETLIHCKSWRFLRVIDLSHNPVSHLIAFRQSCLYYVTSLRYINGTKVHDDEVKRSVDLFGGLVDYNYLVNVFSKSTLTTLTHLNLQNSSISGVSLSKVSLAYITSITLDHNKITHFDWVHQFPNVIRLNLSHNHINGYSNKSAFGVKEYKPCSRSLPCSVLPSIRKGSSPTHASCDVQNDSDTRQCISLRSLYLDHNQIRSITSLQLHRFPNVSLLVLSDNEISSLAGLTQNSMLEKLVLDRNNISSIDPGQTESLVNLLELYLERNFLSQLEFLRPLTNLQRLFLGYNKIGVRCNLGALGQLKKLRELTVHGNPLFRSSKSYRDHLPRLPSLALLDGHPVHDLS